MCVTASGSDFDYEKHQRMMEDNRRALSREIEAHRSYGECVLECLVDLAVLEAMNDPPSKIAELEARKERCEDGRASSELRIALLRRALEAEHPLDLSPGSSPIERHGRSPREEAEKRKGDIEHRIQLKEENAVLWFSYAEKIRARIESGDVRPGETVEDLQRRAADWERMAESSLDEVDKLRSAR